MCGLAGILTLSGPPPDRLTLQAMAQSVCHRGPDAEGFLEDTEAAPAVALVHRRLSIIDTRHVADQPMPNEDGSVQVLLNGEIYNFRELRSELEARHTFRSRGDTEVIAHLYEELGEHAIDRLDGMFALALWDARRRRLLLARDHFGKKPLYWSWDGRRFVFGSEIKALLAAGVTAAHDQTTLPELLAYGYVPTPRTSFKGILRLPPGSVMTVDASGPCPPRPFWDLRYPDADNVGPIAERDAIEGVRERLAAAVRRRLVADVPLGVLLSGGVDSSAVAALMAREGPGPVKTFTVGFDGDAFWDERPWAARVAKHLGTEHYDSLVRPRAAELIETLLAHHDEPFGDSSALPTYLVAQEARRHVTVALNGDGGDETFAGYERFHAAVLAERIPAPLRRLAANASGLLPHGSDYHSLARRARRFTEKAALPPADRLFSWTSVFDLPALRALLCEPLDETRVVASYREAFDAQPGASLLSRLLYTNARTYLLDDLLPKMDRMSMAHGLETRSPMLDRELVEYVARLPDALKRRGFSGKRVLKMAVADLLPPGVLHRRKHGFGVPLGDWFRGELRPMVQETLLGRPRLGSLLREDTLRALITEHMSGRADWGHRLWTLLTVELWLRKHSFG